MPNDDIEKKLAQQQAYFATGATLPVKFRLAALKKLRDAIERYEVPITDALRDDLGKSGHESYMCEIALVKSELHYMLRHVRRFVREKRVHTPLAQWISRSYEKPSPYGCVLIMSPWNYPFLLTLDPLIDALAAGNTAMVKPSAYSPRTSAVVADMIASCFPPEYVTVITGGRQENARLLQCGFDSIFFTGSKSVGREVMRQAAERLIPVTLELGGKSPCLVDPTADLALAARRIVFGKFVNCGQTCVAPDYLYCHRSVKERLVEELQRQIRIQYGERPLQNPDYGRIVNRKHFDRLSALLDPSRTVCGGETCAETLQIAPTVLDGVTWDDPVMQDEIFGPILPILVFDDIREAVARIDSGDLPLALYLFSSDSKTIRYVTEKARFGGGCVNDTLVHLATSAMGFGGVGESGMGSYHGKRGFDTFTHYKSIVDKKTLLDLPMRYQPYRKVFLKCIRLFVR